MPSICVIKGSRFYVYEHKPSFINLCIQLFSSGPIPVEHENEWLIMYNYKNNKLAELINDEYATVNLVVYMYMRTYDISRGGDYTAVHLDNDQFCAI